jgi:uncharacterized protein (TIGR04551 family)
LKRILSNSCLALLWLFVATPIARAQFGGQPGGVPGGPPMGEEPREEGPAEEAPEEEEQPVDLEPLGGFPGQARRIAQVIELDGYFRTRADFFHKLHLDQTYFLSGTDERTPPFPWPLECQPSESRCPSKNLAGGNLRLRLEPTINVTDQVRVVAQVDVLDNLVMGSTPDSLIDIRRPDLRTDRARSDALHNTQVSPDAGHNSLVSSVRAKRAWGEVDTEFGSLRFGRMPWHFGRGIAFNNGACPDCDEGTTVDRIMALTQVYGHQVALAWDFGAQGYHLGLTDLGRLDRNQPPLDLSQKDDVLQITAAITRIDDERRFQDRAAQGELMFNYGAQLVFRQQDQAIYELREPMQGIGTPTDTAPTRDDLSRSLTENVNALSFLPSLWMKLAWKALTVEAEVSGVLGRIANAGPLTEEPSPMNKRLALRQLGWVVASELGLYRNAFFVGFETGGATGDQAEDPKTYLNHRWKFVPQPVGDRAITDFKFSPDYHVDQILFRRIIGSVTNAIYVKPQMTYWLDLAEQRQLGLSAAFIYSLAPVPVATPGNALSYGVEMNLGLTYRNPADGFFANLTWAVLWPLGALNRPDHATSSGTPLWPRSQDASSAQAVRAFVGILF